MERPETQSSTVPGPAPPARRAGRSRRRRSPATTSDRWPACERRRAARRGAWGPASDVGWSSWVPQYRPSGTAAGALPPSATSCARPGPDCCRPARGLDCPFASDADQAIQIRCDASAILREDPLRTFTPKPADINRAWHVIDAEGLVLGASPPGGHPAPGQAQADLGARTSTPATTSSWSTPPSSTSAPASSPTSGTTATPATRVGSPPSRSSTCSPATRSASCASR